VQEQTRLLYALQPGKGSKAPDGDSK
jgi:hypothetical protein